MVKAATGGGGSTEPLPIVFVVPKLLSSPLDRMCSDLTGHFPYSLLGYGDVGVPGLLVALCLKFDMTHRATNKCRLYFCVASLGETVCPLLRGVCDYISLPYSIHCGARGYNGGLVSHEDCSASIALFSAHYLGFYGLTVFMSWGISSLLHRKGEVLVLILHLKTQTRPHLVSRGHRELGDV